ncbi:MAG: long-chain fatty acid--CoA ligase [Gemmataceae bacterium]
MVFRNLGSVVLAQARRLGPRPALRYRRHGLYYDHSWNDYAEEVRTLASALIHLGLAPGERVGLLGENSRTWLSTDLAILLAGGVNVTPHAPLTARQVHYQLHDSETSWVFVSDRIQLDKIRSMRCDLPRLRGVIVFDAAACGPGEIPWSALVQQGRVALSSNQEELLRREHAIGPDDLATLMYTSGTTGQPKGVMLTHGNVLSNVEAVLQVQPQEPGDVILSWLPYTHIYARTCDHYLALLSGTTLALAESPETLVERLAEVAPTHMASVPRFYEKVLNAVASSDAAVTAKRLRHVFGPRISWLSSGGAPLPVPIAQAYQAAGLPLMQGYGLTESSPVISFNSRAHNRLGTVGRAVPGVEVCIAPDGEVLSRGPHIMKGYWKNPEATAEAIRDGWLHTGDLGTLDADGFLSITGRKKELLVLSNGKKVVPSYLEGLLIADPCIDQAVVCGEGRNFLTALLVPHWDNVRKALEIQGQVVHGDADTLSQHPTVIELVSRRCRQALADLSSAEQIKKFVLLSRPFSVEAEELTVSLKLRRSVILEHNNEELEKLYQE